MLLPRLPLALESPVLIRVDGRDLVVLFCTPLALDDLAVGHLVGRGLLPSRDSLRSIFICDDRGRVDIERVDAPPLPSGGVAIIASSCGAGAIPGEIFGLVAPPDAPDRGEGLFSIADLAERAKEMFSGASMHRVTGGMHCAALAQSALAQSALSQSAGAQSALAQSVGAPPIILREDVGRHNAVDKVIGRAFLDGIDLSQAAIITSGRIAADMVAKAIHAGIPLLVSRSVPTTSAFELARAFGIALVGRVLSAAPLVYCGDRLIQ